MITNYTSIKIKCSLFGRVIEETTSGVTQVTVRFHLLQELHIMRSLTVHYLKDRLHQRQNQRCKGPDNEIQTPGLIKGPGTERYGGVELH